jgi:hypothetical protein
MPWLFRATTEEHVCQRPSLEPSELEQATAGDLWQCEVCAVVWKVVGNGALEWEEVNRRDVHAEIERVNRTRLPEGPPRGTGPGRP